MVVGGMKEIIVINQVVGIIERMRLVLWQVVVNGKQTLIVPK
jgi:hypothetical protein